MKRIFWFCLLAMMAVAGCKDECDDYSNYHKIDDRMRPYLFKEGTYWIYQNSVTGEIDSEYVSRVSNYLDTIIYMKYTCGVNHVVSEVVSMIHKSSLNPGDSLEWEYGAKSKVISVGYAGIYNVLFALYDKVNWAGPCLTYQSVPDSLLIGTKLFNQVDLFTLSATTSECTHVLTYTTDFYFSPHFGVIKKVEYDTPNGTQEWNLIRWNIVQ